MKNEKKDLMKDEEKICNLMLTKGFNEMSLREVNEIITIAFKY